MQKRAFIRYTLKSPDGAVIITDDLYGFCRENKLKAHSFRAAYHNNRPYRGWTILGRKRLQRPLKEDRIPKSQQLALIRREYFEALETYKTCAQIR